MIDHTFPVSIKGALPSMHSKSMPSHFLKSMDSHPYSFANFPMWDPRSKVKS